MSYSRSQSARLRARHRFPLPAVEALEDRTLLAGAAGGLIDFDSIGIDLSRFSDSRLLVQLRDGADDSAVFGDVQREQTAPGFFELTVAAGVDVWNASQWYRQFDAVLYAEPDFQIQLATSNIASIPNDTSFGSQWALHNTGQTGGTPDADIDAPEAWSVTVGSDTTIVAVIDTGVDYTHPDLAANIWVNGGEVAGNGLDDDGNGYVDDVHGYDFANDDPDPQDDNGHGTHVAGIIGAAGNNALGVVGVAQNVRIMSLKFLDDNGSGFLSDAVRAINYATANGAHISNNSWGGGGFSSAMQNAISQARAASLIFVGAAGNSGTNSDASPTYPAGYSLDNVVSVAATDDQDHLAGFSNYGAASVDLGAPGVGILSTYPGARYASFSGTSMATPHVSGVMALVRSLHPEWSHQQVIAQVLGSVDPIADLQGKSVSGGRLNAAKAVGAEVQAEDNDDHGDTPETATQILVGQSPESAEGNIEEGGDDDWFALAATAGRAYRLETTLGTLRDTTLTLYDTDGEALIAFNDDGGPGLASRIDWIAQAAGTYYIKVAAYNASQTGTYSLTVTPQLNIERPEWTGPEFDVVDPRPTLEWLTTAGADAYDVLLYDLAAGQLVEDAIGWQQTSLTVGTDLAANRRYQAWVRGRNNAGEIGQWSDPLEFYVHPSGAPLIVSPGTTTYDATPLVTWQADASAVAFDVLMYDLFAGRQVAAGAGLTETSFQVVEPLAAGRVYHLYVRSMDATGVPSQWAGAHEFTVLAPLPPESNDPPETADLSPTINWNSADGAAAYDLLLYDVAAGKLVESAQALAGTSYSLTETLEVDRSYTVYARSINDNGDGGYWGHLLSFDVVPAAQRLESIDAVLGELFEVVPRETIADLAAYWQVLDDDFDPHAALAKIDDAFGDVDVPALWRQVLEDLDDVAGWKSGLEFDASSALNILDDLFAGAS